MPRLVHTVVLSLLALAGSSGMVLAQQAGTGASSAAPASVSWSDPEFAAISGMLAGTWKTSAPIAAGGASYDVLMTVAPVALADVPDAMYVEIARGDAPDRPYRQSIWRLYRRQGEIRLQTLEFRRAGGEMNNLVGMWAAPAMFPTLKMSDLVGTLDIALTRSGDGYSGKTPHPYPTAAGGATEMTSEITFGPTTFTSADRGIDASGAVVWGPAAGQSYTFSRSDSPAKVSTIEGGVVVLSYPTATKGDTFSPGTRLTCNYVGQLLSNGMVFDTSYERGQPFSYNHGQKLIAGWTNAMADAQAGMKRRLIIPGPMAYGEQGQPRAKIPSNATLVFDIEVLNIEKLPEPAAPAPAQPIDVKPIEIKPADVKPAGQ